MKRRSIKLIHDKILRPISIALKKGISIRKISTSLALGITIGLIPFYGITTLLITVIALSLRLNFVAMQVAHFIVHPLQIALLIPFFKIASIILPMAGDHFTIANYFTLFKENFWSALQELWLVNLSAVFIWFLVSIPLFLGLNYLIHFTLKKYAYSLVRLPHGKYQ